MVSILCTQSALEVFHGFPAWSKQVHKLMHGRIRSHLWSRGKPAGGRAHRMALCGSWAEKSPLEKYAKSLQIGSNEDNEGSGPPMRFPMYTLPLDVLLKMRELLPHEELKRRDELVEFVETMGNAAFVSHEWVGDGHPDPEMKQLEVLQAACRNIIFNLKFIPVDAITDILLGKATPLSTKDFRSAPLFFWYDFFSCPQLEGKLAGKEGSGLGMAIESIPAYICHCKFFFILCPVIESPCVGRVFSPFSWSERGWCRAERTCRELCIDQTCIMVKGATEVELVVAPSIEHGAVGEGKFTEPKDKEKLDPILKMILRRRLNLRLKAGDLPGYRVILNMQSVHLKGFPGQNIYEGIPGFQPEESDASSLVSKFFHENGFKSLKEVDSNGWRPLHYAALRGDELLVLALLEQRAELNCGTKKDEPRTGVAAGQTPLQVCLFFKHNKAAQVLISAGAKVEGGLLPPMHRASHADNAEGIRLLCRARAASLATDGFGVSPLHVAATFGCCAAVEELVAQAGSSLQGSHLSHALFFAVSFRGGSAQLTQRLLELRADVNVAFKLEDISNSRSLLKWRALSSFACWSYAWGFLSSNINCRWAYHNDASTPLMAAMLSKQHEAAAVLIAEGARLDLRNSHGWTAEKFGEESNLPDFLKEAFEERQGGCKRVAAVAQGFVRATF